MESVELKISIKDWIYIGIIGISFGFFLSLLFYILNDNFSNFSTILFGTATALCITIFSSIFISVSNNYILPELDAKFWYIISFSFTFLSGALGFLFSYFIFYIFDAEITNIIEPYSLYLTLTIGSLTFLIGLILHQFISMKYKNESIKNEILNSKIKALENELNPHFLFNALNSMSELVYIDSKKAEESILNLSKFLRNATKIDSLVNMKNEIEMVQTYVDIENIRFDDKIKLQITMSNKKDIKLPKFSIQLLVENAIKHGYIGKVLNIYINIDDNIYISNDGKITQNIKFGTGLSNLNKRLKLLNVGKLEFESSDDMRFKIKVNK
jgi:two-component system LytT family sensor kinase